ncbi:MAG: hypothetical protein BWY49_00692 [Candidatus Omnitrophica bacterium ADurb.Bin314]|nr:MAG: hypothetical protein BWY49_00692 [Candidatus Omnitrophica bacterium ADurb.Bin314]
MHRDRGVSEHRFGPGCRDHDMVLARFFIRTLFPGHRILDMIETALYFLVSGFLVGKRGLAARAPVDDVVPAVDEAAFIERDEGFAHGLRKTFVHREPLAGPVAGSAETTELIRDGRTVGVLPRPHLFEEFLTSEIPAGLLFLRKLFLNNVLGRNARVVHARNPERVVPLHPVPADHDVLDGVVERVTHVENARNVRRRYDYDIRRESFPV